MSDLFTVKYFRRWHRFVEYVKHFDESWCFRGQGNAEWSLETTLERSGFFKLYPNIEQDYFADFVRSAHLFLNGDKEPKEIIEWLSLMQHHGAPTRLLDFTYSLYVASYFAFEDASSNSKNVAIWMVNKDKLFNYYRKYYQQVFDEDVMNGSEHYLKVFTKNDASCIIPLEPLYKNKRYFLQQSMFLSLGNSCESFSDQLSFLHNELKSSVFKFVLPSSIRNEVLRELEKMNVTRATLFPDIDGYAKFIKTKYSLKQDYGESIKKQVEALEKLGLLAKAK